MDYAAFQALAANYEDTSATLSANSVALLLSLVRLALEPDFWTNYDPSSDWDTIEALVAEAILELSP